MRALLALSLVLSTLVAGCERPHAHPAVVVAPATSAVPAPIPPPDPSIDASKRPNKLAGDPRRNAASGPSLQRGDLHRRSGAEPRDRSLGDTELCPGLASQALDDCLALEEGRLGGAPARGDEQALRDFREEQAQRDRELFDQDANSGYGPDPVWDPSQARLPPPGYDPPPENNDLPPDDNEAPPYYSDDDLPPDEQFFP